MYDVPKHSQIRRLIIAGQLREPFTLQDVQRVSNVLDNDPGYLSAREISAKNSLRKYFVCVTRGYYEMFV
jgi:hypothetical protein